MRRRPHQTKAKWDVMRGRHKKGASRETRYWNEHHLPALPEPEPEPEPEPKPVPVRSPSRAPAPPPWMDPETAEKLLALREECA